MGNQMPSAKKAALAAATTLPNEHVMASERISPEAQSVISQNTEPATEESTENLGPDANRLVEQHQSLEPAILVPVSLESQSNSYPMMTPRAKRYILGGIAVAFLVVISIIIAFSAISGGQSASAFNARVTNSSRPIEELPNLNGDYRMGMYYSKTFDPNRSLHSINYCGAEGKYIVLTFDDGPDVATTPRVLADLGKAQVPATFFLAPALGGDDPSGSQCDLVRRIREANHSVQSHSWNHLDFKEFTREDDIIDNLEKTKHWIEKCANESNLVKYFRPPFGSLDNTRAKFISRLGYTVVSWTIDSLDWQGETMDTVLKRTLAGFDELQPPSAILLLHDKMYKDQQTAGIIPSLVKELKDRGYQFVTLDQCMTQCAKFSTVCKLSDIWPGVYDG